jgi:hypothetical protein
MQPHEGPRRDRNAEERTRQRRLTGLLSAAIGVLLIAIAVTLGLRWM